MLDLYVNSIVLDHMQLTS